MTRPVGAGAGLALPPWAVPAVAAVAGVAGILAVVLASPGFAVAGGTASAVTAVLVLLGPRPGSAPDTEVPAAAVGPEPVPEDLDELDDDPMRALFESGPPAGGSGLLSPDFLLTTLRGRVAVARRALRPLSVVCFETLETEDGLPTVPVARETVAAILRRTLREADVSGRGDGDAYVCILEDTGEDGAVWTAERVRRNLTEGGHVRRFRAGIASYPTHGLEPEELEAKARAALVSARDWATDRIEVATV